VQARTPAVPEERALKDNGTTKVDRRLRAAFEKAFEHLGKQEGSLKYGASCEVFGEAAKQLTCSLGIPKPPDIRYSWE